MTLERLLQIAMRIAQNKHTRAADVTVTASISPPNSGVIWRAHALAEDRFNPSQMTSVLQSDGYNEAESAVADLIEKLAR